MYNNYQIILDSFESQASLSTHLLVNNLNKSLGNKIGSLKAGGIGIILGVEAH